MIYVMILLPLLLLSVSPAYAEWVWIDKGKPGMTIYVNRDTIHRKGNLVTMWELFNLKTAQKVRDLPHSSFKMQSEYDCAEERTRRIAVNLFSGKMGRGAVIYSDSTKERWESILPGSINYGLWKFACGKKRLKGPYHAKLL